MADRKKLEELVARINRTSNADFVRRLLDEKRKVLKNNDGTVSTHELGYVTEGDEAVVFPSVQSVGDSLARFPYPESYERAVEKGDTVHMSIPDAELFTTGYKSYYPGFDKYSDGGSIHIKPSHRGKLTELKERTGKTEAELYSDGNPAHKKMVVFAWNARKRSRADGGFLTDYPGSGTIIPVMPGDYSGGVVVDDGGGSRGVEPAIDFAGMKLRQRYAESGFKDNLTSRAGAIGRYQIMPITYKEYTQRTGKTGDLLDPVFNEGLRDWYMDENLPKYNAVKRGNPSDLVREYRKYAAYNMGPGALNKALSKAEADGIDIDNSTLWLKYLPKETRDYVNFIVGGEDVPDTAKTQALYDAAVKKYGIQMSCGGKIHKFDAGGFIEKYGANAIRKALGKIHKYDGESESTGLLYKGAVPLMYDVGQERISGISKQNGQDVLFGGKIDNLISSVPFLRKKIESDLARGEKRRKELTKDQSRLRAEMMTRYSGGVRDMSEAVVMPMRRNRLWRTFTMDKLDNKVYSGKLTPKQKFENAIKQDPINYTGVADLYSLAGGNKRQAFNTTMFTRLYDNDLVSSLFNGEMPFSEEKMQQIPAADIPLYGRVLSGYDDVLSPATFRGYQTHPDTLQIAGKLTDLALSGNYTPEIQHGTGFEWLVPGQRRYIYDVGNNTLLKVPYEGKTYAKNIDVFDVEGLGKEGVPKQMTDFISETAIPYVLATPWYLYESLYPQAEDL